MDIKEVASVSFAEVFGSSVEQRALNGKACFLKEEVVELATLLRSREKGFKPEVITGEKLPSKQYEEYPEKYRRTYEALDWTENRFFDLASEVIAMFGEEFNLGQYALEDVFEKIKARENPFRTFSEDFPELPQVIKNTVYRMNGVLDGLYNILVLCAFCEDDELFPVVAGNASRSIGWQITRGQELTKKVVVVDKKTGDETMMSKHEAVRKKGASGDRVRPLPIGGVSKIIEAMLS